jgi:hypothetical protein
MFILLYQDQYDENGCYRKVYIATKDKLECKL